MIEKSYREMALFRGILLVLLGIFALAWPTFTLSIALMLLGTYLLVAGIVEVISGILSIFRWYGIPEIVLGVLALILGLVIIRHPGVALVSYVYLIGIWFIIKGITNLFYDRIGTSKGLAVFLGIIGIVFGILLLIKPIAAGMALFWVIGIYALIAGASWITAAFFIGTSRRED